MRQFSHKGLRIEQLTTEAKLVYSGFALFALAGIAVSVLLYGDMFGGAGTGEVASYYAGTEQAPAAEPELTAGPTIELPDDELDAAEVAAPIVIQASERKLLEVTHFHLFTVPIFLLVISHLFMLCVIRPGLKRGIVVIATLSTALHLAAPWIVRGVGAGAAWLVPVTGAVMGATMTLMAIWPMVAMWRSPPRRPRHNDPQVS